MWSERNEFRFSACCFFSSSLRSPNRFVSAASANVLQFVGFLGDADLDLLRLFDVLLVGNLEGCSRGTPPYDHAG